MSKDILERILARKREELAELRRAYSERSLREKAAGADEPRGFTAALRQSVQSGKCGVIAEAKKASPSKGVIRADFDPAGLALQYTKGGATCLSVLTDRDFFQGDNDHLIAARSACPLPILRKDFLIDPLQVVEARALKADAILLIAAALGSTQMNEMASCAMELDLDVLIEIHDASELDTVLRANVLQNALLGINNRNLRDFTTSIETTLNLIPRLPADCEVVTESGIRSRDDINKLRAAGVHRFLIGESLMLNPRPGQALRSLLE